MPDELLARAKSSAAINGISLRQFFIEAVQSRLTPEKRKTRKVPPSLGDADERPMRTLTREQIDEALFG